LTSKQTIQQFVFQVHWLNVRIVLDLLNYYVEVPHCSW